MPTYFCDFVNGHQSHDQRVKRRVLQRRERVFKLSVCNRPMTAKQADSDRPSIVVHCVRTDLFNRSALGNGAVAVDQEMIADVFPAIIVHMPAPHLCNLLAGRSVPHPFRTGGRAMADHLIDRSHGPGRLFMLIQTAPLMNSSVAVVSTFTVVAQIALRVSRHDVNKLRISFRSSEALSSCSPKSSSAFFAP